MHKTLLLIPLLAATLLSGCGASQAFKASPPASGAAGTIAPAPAVRAQGPATSVAQAQPAAPALAQAGAAGPADGLPSLPTVGRMVIKNGSLSIAVDDPETTLSQVDQVVAAAQGVIASQSTRTQDDQTFVNLTIQVPPDQFEPLLGQLRGLRAHGTKVLNDTVSTQDVTEQYVDLDAQYRNLQTTRDAYQKLLDKATAVSDIITLTREVANIQTQMDQIKGRENLLSRQSAVSTINLMLSPVGAAASPAPKPLLQPLQAAQQAWSALLTGLQGAAVVLIWMGILLPVPAIILVGGWLAFRRWGRRPGYQVEGSRN